MNRDDLLKIARESLQNHVSSTFREPGWVLRHGVGTANLALTLRQVIMPQDNSFDDLLYAAALFHDCGKYATGHEGEDHGELGAARARELLGSLLPAQELNTVCQAISVHNKRKQRLYTPLEMLLQDADSLDHRGTMGIWIHFAYCFSTGQGPQGLLDYRESGFDEMNEEVINGLNYSQSLIAYNEKIAFEMAFIQRLEREIPGMLDYPLTQEFFD